MEVQSVSDSAPNPIALVPLTEPIIEPPETICFYCKLPRSQCSNQTHWDKKLETEKLSANRGMSGPDGKNFVTIKEFERIQAAEIKKEIGRVTPDGQSPDVEDASLNSSRDLHWIEKNAWRAVDELEEELIRHYIEKCPDPELAVRWLASFPEYLQGILLGEWVRLALIPALHAFASALIAEYKTETLDLTCSKCGEHAKLTLKIFSNASILEPKFTCADCLGRFTREFTPRSKVRKWPSCRRQKRKAALKELATQ